MRIRIVSGGCGLHTPSGVKLITKGQTADFPEESAQHLISIGAAVPAELEVESETGSPEPVAKAADTPDPDNGQETEADEPAADTDVIEPEEEEIDLNDLSVEELKAFCREAGVDIKGIRSKAGLISAYEAQSLPELGAEDPI